MPSMDAVAETVRRYARFAVHEAPGRSPLYAAWARTVADDLEIAQLFARIPRGHRQPPLVFAVARMLGLDERADALAPWLGAHIDALVGECSRRSIQTNEPLRCATLTAALSLIDGPIALVEVGASAGLCLYPHRYRYRYRHPDRRVTALEDADSAAAPVLECELRGALTPSLRLPEVVWAAGIDTNPLDVRRPADLAWLTGLVWPGETGRVDRIERAAAIAASDPPLLVAGDAADVLDAVVESAPGDATLVVTTPGVLAHVPPTRRSAVIERVRRAGRWATIDEVGTHDAWRTAPPADGFVLGLDGEILARTDPLGGWLEWRHGSAAMAG